MISKRNRLLFQRSLGKDFEVPNSQISEEIRPFKLYIPIHAPVRDNGPVIHYTG